MILEQQVVNVDLAKRLDRLLVGVQHHSHFDWVEFRDKKSGEVTASIVHGSYGMLDHRSYKNIARCAAYSVAELGEMLPWRSKRMGTVNNAELITHKLVNTATSQTIWRCGYWDEDKHLYEHEGFVVEFTADTEADARAQMLIHLIENNLITV